MRIEIEKIKCKEIKTFEQSNRESDFWISKYIFNYNTSTFDKALLKKIESVGNKLAEAVNDGAANDSTTKRSIDRKKSNAIAGVLAEYCWKNFLNSISLETLVQETEYESNSNQIDLIVIESNKTIEVRSSFPRNGIEFAICSPKFEFDILGPYSNSYKPNEPQKDFYLRTLFHVHSPLDFLTDFKKDNFTVYLTGGATWEMMVDDKFSKDKNLIPDDAISDVEVESTYRVVPFSNALDCAEIYKLIKA
jgi:hypothetical protein